MFCSYTKILNLNVLSTSSTMSQPQMPPVVPFWLRSQRVNSALAEFRGRQFLLNIWVDHASGGQVTSINQPWTIPQEPAHDVPSYKLPGRGFPS